MTLPYTQASTTYRTVSVGSDPSGTFLSPGSDGGSMTYRTLNVPSPMSQVQYINGAMDGNAHISDGGAMTYRTLNVSSPQVQYINGAMDGNVPISDGGAMTYRTLNVSSPQVQYINGAMDGNAVYGGVRYLVPVQRNDSSYVVVNQAAQVRQQVMPQQVLTPVYLQNYGVQRGSASSVDEAEIVYRHVEVSSKVYLL